MADYKNIAVKPETYERFKLFGMFQESADEVMARILGIVEKAMNFASEVERASREKASSNNGKYERG